MRALLGVMCFSLAMSTVGQGRGDRLPDTPANHWVYEAVMDLKAGGIVHGYPDGLGPSDLHWQTRPELAEMAEAAGTALHILARALRNPMVGADRPAALANAPHVSKLSLSDASGVRQGVGFLSDDMERLVGFLSPELRARGIAPAEYLHQIKRDLDSIVILAPRDPTTKQFTDVPKGHWAAAAALNLRSEGILRGYPDVDFRG